MIFLHLMSLLCSDENKNRTDMFTSTWLILIMDHSVLPFSVSLLEMMPAAGNE